MEVVAYVVGGLSVVLMLFLLYVLLKGGDTR